MNKKDKCVDCQPGQASADVGAVECTSCLPGKVSESQATGCKECKDDLHMYQHHKYHRQSLYSSISFQVDMHCNLSLRRVQWKELLQVKYMNLRHIQYK